MFAAGLVVVAVGLLAGATRVIKAALAFIKQLKALGSELRGVQAIWGAWRRDHAERRIFCAYMSNQVRKISSLEQWHDARYTELEATIEAEGGGKGLRSLLHTGGTRRERSLSRALRRSREDLIVLEGQPGTGKSVALRHVALVLLRRASHSLRPQVLVPLYVNLKD